MDISVIGTAASSPPEPTQKLDGSEAIKAERVSDAEVTPAQVDEAVEDLNQHLSAEQSTWKFERDDASGKDIIVVVDRTTDEVVRQVPTDEVLVLARAVRAGSALVLSTRA